MPVVRGGDRALGVGTAADGARRGPWAAGAAAPWPLSGLRGVTQVLLPATLLLRRADVAAVVYRALVWWAVGGLGRRRIAGLLGVARSTVRGWLARFEVLAEVLRAHFTRWASWLEPAWTRLESHGWVVADALAALLAAGEAACRAHGGVGVWEFASMTTGGRLLANTSAPFPAPWTG